MIKSKIDYQFYLEADRIAFPVERQLSFRARMKPNRIYDFLKLLRKIEYYQNCKKDPVSRLRLLYFKLRFDALSLQLGYSIPPGIAGPGFSLGHYGTIVINGATRLGANCRLHVCVNIGGIGDKAPQIGDHVYIGPGAKLFGDISIPKNVSVGANAVVNKTVPTENCTIGGVPAKVISDKGTVLSKRFEENVIKYKFDKSVLRQYLSVHGSSPLFTSEFLSVYLKD